MLNMKHRGRPPKIKPIRYQIIPDLLNSAEQLNLYRSWLIYFNPSSDTSTDLIQFYICVLHVVMTRECKRDSKLSFLGSSELVPIEFLEIFHIVCNKFQAYYLRPEAVKLSIKIYGNDMKESETVGHMIKLLKPKTVNYN